MLSDDEISIIGTSAGTAKQIILEERDITAKKRKDVNLDTIDGLQVYILYNQVN